MHMIGKFYSLLALSIMVAPHVYAAAGDQTVSVGYAHVNGGFAHDAYLKNKADYDSHLKNIPDGKLLSHNSDSEKDPQGFFVRYRYEFDDVWGIMGALNYASTARYNEFVTAPPKIADKKQSQMDEHFTNSLKIQSISLLVGPSIRANEWVSLFGLVGATHQKLENAMYHYKKKPRINMRQNSISNKTEFAYTLGMQFNVYKDFVIDAAWTGTNSGNANGFNLGMGYRF